MLLLLAGLVQAAEGDLAYGPEDVSVESATMSRSRDGSNTSGTKSGSQGTKSSSDASSEGTFFKKGKLWGWNYRPYVTPGGGLSIASGGTAITGGADVGVRYWKKNWKGDLSLGGSYTTGSALNGYDLHVGNEFGRREKWWGVSLGLVLFYDGYTDENGGTALDPSLGLDVPLELTLGPRKYYLYGGVTPSFLFDRDRHAAGLPFGDELEWEVGAGVHLKWITAEAGFNQRITAIGVINTPTLTLSVSGQD